jgi:UDP-N-acetylmuramate-alanine ligase
LQGLIPRVSAAASVYVQKPDELSLLLGPLLRDGDIVVTQGAGSVGALARQLAADGLMGDSGHSE